MSEVERERPASPAGPQFVAVSELVVPEAGRDALRAAFLDRLGEVDKWPGFQGLQVLADLADPC